MPEQDLGSECLFVPLRTEEVGWEEGGLIWAAKRYCYPTVNLYGGADDHVIGTYRGGPKGYRFINITDPSFSLSESDSDSKATPENKPSRKTGSGSKTSLPRSPATAASATSPQTAAEHQKQDAAITVAESSTSCNDMDLDEHRGETSRSSPMTSSSASSRQGSFSTDGGSSSGADTGMTTPTMSESPSEDKDLSSRLDAALAALQQDQDLGSDVLMSGDGESSCTAQRQLASRTGAVKVVIPAEPVDVARLAGPLKEELKASSSALRDRSMRLSEQVPADRFQSYRGRASSQKPITTLQPMPNSRPKAVRTSLTAADEYAAGWAYEQNMRAQHANSPLKST